jgi:arginyl-tRNA synthetase
MVELPEGKMKSREGTVVDSDDLLAEMSATAQAMGEELGKTESFSPAEKEQLYKQVGYGALKYFLLKVSPRKSMMFDPKASIDFIGNTGPFIQFNHVRARSVLRKADMSHEALLQGLKDAAPAFDADERYLLQLALGLPEVIHQAAEQYDPSLLANFSYDVMKAYSSWYADHPILQEADESVRLGRLGLSELAAQVVARAMGLLGIEMPERM